MIQELQDAINKADVTNNQKAKKILLKIAEAPEDKQKKLFNVTKLIADILVNKDKEVLTDAYTLRRN